MEEMRKNIESAFHKLVVSRFGFFEAKHLNTKMGLPAHPVTKAFKSPENTPHKILIAFSELLEVHPYELIQKYELGRDRVSAIEKEYHRKDFESSGKKKRVDST